MIPEIDYNNIDKKVEDGTLTDKDVDNILNTIKEASSKNADLKILNEIKRTPLKPGEEGTVGGYIKAQIKIDPVTGEKVNLSECGKVSSIEDIYNDSKNNLLDTLSNADNSVIDISGITIDDIKSKTKIVFNIPEEEVDKYNISDEEAQILIDIINDLRENKNINIYNRLPDTVKIKELINKTLSYKGFADNSTISKTARNNLCLQIISAYITSISKDKYESSVVKMFEEVQKDDIVNINNISEDYEKQRRIVLESLKEAIDLDDTSNKEKIDSMLDAINDAIELNRVLDIAPKCKIKSIDIEKPQRRIFDVIESKYRYNENLHIPALSSLFNILSRHNKRSDKDNLKFFLALSRTCMNYDINNYTDHLFIYSVCRNIINLDIYQNEGFVNSKFSNFNNKFLKKINMIIDKVK